VKVEIPTSLMLDFQTVVNLLTCDLFSLVEDALIMYHTLHKDKLSILCIIGKKIQTCQKWTTIWNSIKHQEAAAIQAKKNHDTIYLKGWRPSTSSEIPSKIKM
jgi:hypothetical protein